MMLLRIKNKSLKYFRIHSLLFLGNFSWFIALSIIYLNRGPRGTFDGITLLLSLLYFVVLNIFIIFSQKQEVKIASFAFVIFSLLYYGQRLVFLYLFPYSGTYDRFFYFTQEHMNKALLFLLLGSISIAIGFNIGEKIKVRINTRDVLEPWYYNYEKRAKFYSLSIIIFVIKIYLYFNFVSGKYYIVWSDNFLSKLFLHFIEFTAILIIIPMIFLINPKVTNSRKERFIIYFIFFLYLLSTGQSGSKDTVGSLIIMYIYTSLLLNKYAIKRNFIFVIIIALIITSWMFVLSIAIRGIFLNRLFDRQDILLLYKEAKIKEENYVHRFANPIENPLVNLLPLSRRLRGIDWIEVAMLPEVRNEAKNYFSMSNLLKHTANRIVPLPRTLLFPEVLRFAAVYPIVIYNIPLENTYHFADYPSLFGLSYILMNYPGICLLFLWAMMTTAILRSSRNILFKVIWVEFWIFNLLESGDITQILKTLIVYYLYFEFIKLWCNSAILGKQ